ncbi:MAG: hypothetical protein ABL889_19855 [Terricaulis sp.]
MSDGRQSTGLVRALLVSATISLVVGLGLAFFLRPQMPFAVAAVGFSTLIASGFLGFPLGEKLDLERRYQKWRIREIVLILSATLAIGLACYMIGLWVPPLIGHSENHILFPGLLFIGVVAGIFESGARFRRR